MSSLSDLGPFERLLVGGDLSVPGYLVCLGLRAGQDTQTAIGQVEDALDAGDSQRWVDALLSERNWRPHLPAAVAHLLAQRGHLSTASLWGAIDEGSWVTPQLVVSALFCDPRFFQHVAERLDIPASPELPPARDEARPCKSPKVTASLLAAAEHVPGLSYRVREWQARPALKALLAEDMRGDRSSEIVLAWKAAAEAAFLVRGIRLAPACETAL